MTTLAVRQVEFLGMRGIVASRAMFETLEFVERVARTGATVLVQGESGCGKELVARALHHYSMRCHRPWVDVSCGALPEHLMESELFGYEKGAFSGADSPKPGLFELAHLGTLFLDEIGELEPRMQVKLLRVLDGAPYFRLGGTRKITVDVRVLAATNQDLERSAEEGRFRGDLFHRLNQVTIKVPPLRERKEDISVLAAYFLAEQFPEVALDDGAAAALHRYAWPGNVRELRNVITRAAIVARDGCIGEQDLNLPQPHERILPRAESRDGDLDGLERRAILEALDETRGHRQQAAERLGISRRTLSRKLRRYGEEGSRVEDISMGRRSHLGAELPGKTA